MKNTVRHDSIVHSRCFVIIAVILLIATCSCTHQEQLPPLHMAAKSGLLVEVKQLIIGGHDVNQRDDTYGLTPLHHAVFYGHKDIVEYLIARGADVNATNNAGSTPLHLAKGKGHQAIAALLTTHGATK